MFQAVNKGEVGKNG